MVLPKSRYYFGIFILNHKLQSNCNIEVTVLFPLVRLLGALCCCICDPGVNTVTQEIKPAESLAQLLLFHLNSKSALQRISVALVICEWAALQKVGCFCSKNKFYLLSQSTACCVVLSLK